jgi:N-ethylmaleimide reductase
MPTLFDPLQAGDLRLPNRIVMAPLTRTRAGTTHMPNALMREYYSQRASAGLIITEATMVAPDASAFIGEPGLYDDATATAWASIVDAVHARGGRIMIQLFHPGRAAHSDINGVIPVSAAARPIRDSYTRTARGKVPYETPRALGTDEVCAVRAQVRRSAELARQAGFDGIQIHGAHGYLVDQFLRDGLNDRSDAYGGSLENRARFLLEVVDDACAAIGRGRVSVRISPRIAYNDMHDSDPHALLRYVAAQLSARGIAFFELRQEQQDDAADQLLGHIARAAFSGPLLVNGGYTQLSADAAVREGRADAVAFGRAYIANPDLVERFAISAPLNAINNSRLYHGGGEGYIDYPFQSDVATAQFTASSDTR